VCSSDLMKVSRGLLAVALLTLALPVCAQSLGDLAKKEQERRKAAPPASKTYTDDDLKKIVPPPGGVPAPAATAGEKDPAASGDQAKGDAAKAGDAKSGEQGDKASGGKMDEAAWRARITAAREDLRRGEAFRDALQSRINGLTGDFVSRDDPAQRAHIADERQKALAELARVNADIEKAKKAINDIEEEARRASVPPGWLR